MKTLFNNKISIEQANQLIIDAQNIFVKNSEDIEEIKNSIQKAMNFEEEVKQ